MGELAGGGSLAVTVGVSERCVVTRNTWHVTGDTRHMICDMWQKTHDICHFFLLLAISVCFGTGATIHTHQKIQCPLCMLSWDKLEDTFPLFKAHTPISHMLKYTSNINCLFTRLESLACSRQGLWMVYEAFVLMEEVLLKVTATLPCLPKEKGKCWEAWKDGLFYTFPLLALFFQASKAELRHPSSPT